MKKTILVVEDEGQIREDIVTALELSDYQTFSAGNGKEALKIALDNQPDLIISDIMMPELDGYGLLREIQANNITASIPFLFLSAKSDRSDVRLGMGLGADDYLTKPFDINELITTVETRLKKTQAFENQYQQKIDNLRHNIRRSLPHEIKTPLNVIIGFSDFLSKNFDNTDLNEAKEMLNHISGAAKRLNKVFEKYLYYANLEIIAANPDEISKLSNERCESPKTIIRDVVASLLANNNRFNDLRLELDDVPVRVSSECLAKINYEILDNCLKYSDSGTKVTVTSRKQGNLYKIIFTDHGRGMSKNQIAEIGAYVQFERRIYEQQGTGLGLAIVNKLVTLYNGNIIIESEPHQYTKVTVEFEIA